MAFVLFALCLVLVGTWYAGSAADLPEPGLLFVVNLVSFSSTILVAWSFATFAARIAAALALGLRPGAVAWLAPPVFFMFGGAFLLFAELVKHFVSLS